MATSQNGYTVITDRADTKNYTITDSLTVPLRPDDAGYVVADFLRKYHEQVEPLGRTETFGWAYRKIAGSNTFSNHSSGTAADTNSAHTYLVLMLQPSEG